MSIAERLSFAPDAPLDVQARAGGLAPPLPEEERIAALGLARSRNVGPRTFAHLVRRFGSASAALEALPELAARGGSPNYRAAERGEVEAEWIRARSAGADLAVIGEDHYPRQLSVIDSAPPTVWVRGAPEIFERPSIAVVGSRNASALGLRTARQMARELGEAGRIVVSGLARGVDAAAHEAALERGTIAVLPGGVDVVYPPENRRLAERILEEDGALISECAMGVEPTGRHFPRRNRLISGLAAGVVLIEAAPRSGSLITARFALEQGREVMACPGSPEDPRSAGCNALIRDGAALVRDAADVLEALEMPVQPGLAEAGAPFRLDGAPVPEEEGFGVHDSEGHESDQALAERIVGLLGPSPVEIDEVARACGAGPGRLSLVLLELELAGRAEVMAGGRIALCPEP